MSQTITIKVIDNPDLVRVSINESGLSRVYTDGDTITGSGTANDPLVAVGVSSTTIGISGVSTYTLIKSQWEKYGDIPVVQVFYNDGSGWTTIPIQPTYNGMPTPTSIVFNFGAVGSYYIVLK